MRLFCSHKVYKCSIERAARAPKPTDQIFPFFGHRQTQFNGIISSPIASELLWISSKCPLGYWDRRLWARMVPPCGPPCLLTLCLPCHRRIWPGSPPSIGIVIWTFLSDVVWCPSLKTSRSWDFSIFQWYRSQEKFGTEIVFQNRSQKKIGTEKIL